MLDPNSNWLRYWFIYMSFLIPVVMFLVSVETVLDIRFSNEYQELWKPFLILAMASFFLHSLMKANTGYYDKGQ